MKLTKVQSEDYSIKLCSENGRWNLFLSPVMYGIRAMAYLNSSPSCLEMNHCLGADQSFIVKAFLTIVRIFEAFPEEASYRQIRPFLPDSIIKPVSLDCCWWFWQIASKHLREQGWQAKFEYKLVQSSEDDQYFLFPQLNEQNIGLVQLQASENHWLIKQFAVTPQFVGMLWEEYLLQRICQYAWNKAFQPVIIPRGLVDDSYLHKMKFGNTVNLWYREAGKYEYEL